MVRLLRSGIHEMYGVADGEGFLLVHILHIDTSLNGSDRISLDAPTVRGMCNPYHEYL